LIANVPDVVMGLPVTERNAGTVAATDVTVPPPVAAIEIEPAPLVIDIPVPAVKAARVKPVPLPISICPLVGAAVSPVPPLATATVPVTFPAVPAVAAFRLATCVVLATVNGAVPVATVDVITPVAETVVNAPVEGVVAPTVPLCGPENCVFAVIVVPVMAAAAVPPIAGGEAK